MLTCLSPLEFVSILRKSKHVDAGSGVENHCERFAPSVDNNLLGADASNSVRLLTYGSLSASR